MIDAGIRDKEERNVVIEIMDASGVVNSLGNFPNKNYRVFSKNISTIVQKYKEAELDIKKSDGWEYF